MEIDCSVPCPVFIRMLNSCPSKPINIFSPNYNTLFELIMVLLSISPYVTSFLFLLSVTYYKTTRGVLIFLMIFAQNLIVEIFKGSLRDPRPNFKCNSQFGNPSNHATFFSSLITWVVMELIILEKRYRFSNGLLKLILFVSYPFIIYSRIYLNYHSAEQITNGIILGVFIGVMWFILSDNFILRKDNPIRRIMMKLQLENNLSDEDFSIYYQYGDESSIYKRILNMEKKQGDLSKMKSELKGFRENLESMEFIQNAKKDIQDFKKND